MTPRPLIIKTIAAISIIGNCGAAEVNPSIIGDYNNTVYAYVNYRQAKPNDGNSISYYGGTLGYAYDISKTFGIEAEFTYLNASKDLAVPYFSNGDYVRYSATYYYEYKYTNYETLIMCSFGENKIFSFGMEYIMKKTEITSKRDGTKTIKDRVWYSVPWDDGPETTNLTKNYALVKMRTSYPFNILSTTNQKICVTPKLTIGAGGAFGNNDSAFAYEGDVKCSASYFYKRHSAFLEFGYRILGTVKDENSYETGFIGRAGYSFNW